MENTMTKQEQVNLRNNLTRRIAAKLAALTPEELAGLGGGTPEQLLREFQLAIELVVQLRARRGATLISPKGVKLKAYLVKGGFGVRIWDGGRRNWEVDETGTLRPQNRRRPLYTTLRGIFVAFQGWKLIVDPSTPPTNHPGLVRPTTDRGERPGAAQSKAKAVVAQPAVPVAPVQPAPATASVAPSDLETTVPEGHHRIYTAVGAGWLITPTVFAAGAWAVSGTRGNYAVTHIPSGKGLPHSFGSKKEASAMASHMHANGPAATYVKLGGTTNQKDTSQMESAFNAFFAKGLKERGVTLKELRTKATELDIAGRSKMNKAALTKAVEEALRP